MREMTQRSARVAKELQRQISMILRDNLRDPRVGFITITGVDITADLRYARVFFTTLGGAVREKSAMAGLKQAGGFIRRLIAERMDFRFVPEVVFKLDTGIQNSIHLEKILKQLKEEKGG